MGDAYFNQSNAGNLTFWTQLPACFQLTHTFETVHTLYSTLLSGRENSSGTFTQSFLFQRILGDASGWRIQILPTQKARKNTRKANQSNDKSDHSWNSQSFQSKLLGHIQQS